MTNPVRLKLHTNDGAVKHIIIEPVLHRDGDNSLQSRGVYKIFKDAAGDESGLFTELKETGEVNNLPDESNPDYIGSFAFDEQNNWKYKGDLLSDVGQNEVAGFITRHKDSA